MPGHLKQRGQKWNGAVAEVMLVADSIDLRSMLGEHSVSLLQLKDRVGSAV